MTSRAVFRSSQDLLCCLSDPVSVHFSKGCPLSTQVHGGRAPPVHRTDPQSTRHFHKAGGMLSCIFRFFIPNPTPFSFFVSSLATAIFSALDVSVDLQYQMLCKFYLTTEEELLSRINPNLCSLIICFQQNRSLFFFLFKLHMESVELLSVLDWN